MSMSVILQIWCQIQRTSSSLRCVNCGPGHIQCNYSSAYSGFNIRLNLSALRLEIPRQFTARYTANLVSNTAHIVQFTLCELWSRQYTKYLQLRIYASIFSCRCLRCYCRYHDNSMRVILQTLRQIQRISSRLCYVNCGPGYIQGIYSSTYLGFNIQLLVSALLLSISRPFNARYTANFEPNTANIRPFTLCERWSRACTKYLQLRIFMLQYSTECICAAIGDTSTIQCALYCKLGAKYSAPHPVYAMCTVVPDIYNVFTAPHIQATIFN
jgi:hypothetical protein